MTMQKIYRALLIAVCAMFTFTSCVKEEGNLFEKSAPVRLNEALANAQKVLTTAENGWVMYYYPGRSSREKGGYMYTMVFTDEEVTVGSELFSEEYTSLYSMSKDDGPVISFDTNNHAFHYFATPSGSSKNLYGESGYYQANGGDFEFMILSASAEKVVLRGKRFGSHILLYPLQEASESYLQQVKDIQGQMFLGSYNGTLNGKELSVTMDLSNRQATFTLPNEKDEDGNVITRKVPYIYTDKGLCLYEPLEMAGATLQNLIFDKQTQKLSAEGVALDLQGALPEGWHAYTDFLGTYTLVYNKGDNEIKDIVIEEDEAGKTYVISGLSEAFDVAATYDLSQGRIHIQAQYVASEKETGTGYRIMMAAHDNAAGKVEYKVGGMYGILNEDGSSIEWVNNGLWSGYKTSGFVLYNFTTSGSRASSPDTNPSAPWLWKGLTGSQANRVPYWTSFTRQ